MQPPVGLAIDLRVEDGAFILGDSPGLGIHVDEAAISGGGAPPSARSSDGPGVRPERAGHRLFPVLDGRSHPMGRELAAS